MFKKPKVAVIVVCCLLIAIAGFTGCASKKAVEPVKTDQNANKDKPAPKPQVKQPERKVVEQKAELKASDLQTVYFDFDESSIKSDMRNALNRNARLLNENKSTRVRLEGHCDERGTNEYNMALGERRANSVKQFLTDYGISSSRITIISYGEERAASSGHNESAWGKNRRCEFTIR